jgi:hypothetical protein
MSVVKSPHRLWKSAALAQNAANHTPDSGTVPGYGVKKERLLELCALIQRMGHVDPEIVEYAHRVFSRPFVEVYNAG